MAKLAGDHGGAAVSGDADIRAFLTAHGAPAEHTLEPLTGGANNRVYHVRAGDRNWVLKQYFRREHDPRDRFGAEHAYYTAIWNAGLRSIPEPLAWDRDRNLALFEFIDGRKLAPDEITRQRIQEALRFIVESNQKAAGARLNPASEACFSLAEHVATVERRIDRLRSITDPDASRFVTEQLAPKWREILARADYSNQSVLGDAQRCLSPSDFGFHNALLHRDGALRFFDFEYAGQDDPAKLVCDFFCQPRLPAGIEHWDYFVDQLAADCGWDDSFAARARLLLPVYQVKWCCIMLNEFLRDEAQRRRFSAPDEDLATRQSAQLERAQAAFQRIP